MALGFVFKVLFTILWKQIPHGIFNFSLNRDPRVESLIKLPSDIIWGNAAPFSRGIFTYISMFDPF